MKVQFTSDAANRWAMAESTVRRRLASTRGAADSISQCQLKLTLQVSLRDLCDFASARWVTLTSSRLGRSADLHAVVAKSVVRSVLRCRDTDAWILVATESAIEPWALRASELFSVPIMRLQLLSDESSSRRRTESEVPCVTVECMSDTNGDALVIETADKVEAAYVRSGGRIFRCLEERVCHDMEASTHVSITESRDCAARDLVAIGAVGRYIGRGTRPKSKLANDTANPTLRFKAEVLRPDMPKCSVDVPGDWMSERGEWLIHCTRGFNRAWPGETPMQYMDAMLLSESIKLERGPLATLARIIRMRCLVAASITTRRKQPVVCFSALPLDELLQRRCYRSHLHRWDYEPFGVAIRMDAAKAIGALPVRYGPASDRPRETDPDAFRFHPIGKTHDWSRECEWRVRGSVDLSPLANDDVRIFAKDEGDVRQKLGMSPWPVDLLN